ncbi:hypothetical protein BDQ17DRAFT_1372464 [Cyathus striatus]|nr:hypothetical protein BDQ17DRAFT_1372464 [Cyathus striatus]
MLLILLCPIILLAFTQSRFASALDSYLPSDRKCWCLCRSLLGFWLASSFLVLWRSTYDPNEEVPRCSNACC